MPKLLAALLACAALFAPIARAQDEPAAQMEFTIEGARVVAQPIAVVPFGGNEGMATDIAAIIEADLVRSGRFSALPRTQMLETPQDPSGVDLKNWRVSGRDYVVMGSVLPRPEGNVVRFYVVDVVRGQRVLALDMPAVANPRLREIAHRVSDLVYEKITGKRGDFATEIAYITASGFGFSRKFGLVIADADGYNPRTVWNSREPLMSPSWSPDGTQIAFVGFEQMKPGIYLYNRNNGSIRKILSERGLNSAPSFSPDGQSLVVTLSYEVNSDLYLVNVDGSGKQRITSSRAIDTEGTFSPDGRQVAFTSDRGGNPQVYVQTLGSDTAKRVTFSGKQNLRPRFSPDGKKLAVVTGDKGKFSISVLNADGTQQKRLSAGPQDEAPTWSPSGNAIMYAVSGNSGAFLRVSPVDGEGSQSLRFLGEIREPAWGPLPPAIAGTNLNQAPVPLVVSP